MYQDRYMNQRIGGKVMKLDSIIIQKSRKEIRAGKIKPPLKIRNKSNDLARIFIRTGVTKRGTPLDYRFRSQETLFYKGFQVRSGTLTWFLAFITGWLCGRTIPLGRLLGCHPEIHRSLHAHKLAETLRGGWGTTRSMNFWI